MSKKIYIDPGHSNIDPGAVSYVVERDLNEKVSKYMADYLVNNYECDVKVDPIANDSLSVIAAAANAWGADLFVSNHFNAGGGDGYEALVYSISRVKLGEIFEKHVKAIGQNSRGVKIRSDLGVLRLTNMPAVLNEGAFVDNKKDIQDWDEDIELKKMGEAYAKAAAEYLGIGRKVAVKETVKEKAKESKEVCDVKLPVLGKGDKGKSVESLQGLLIYKGYNCGGYGADGDFGNGTEKSVKKYQQDNKLTADGIVGEKTWSKLLGV